jgi:hypothetical protein
MRGRLEGQITVPSPGWRVSATNSIGGPTTVTVPAASYYLSTLITTFQTQLNASRPSGWTVTASLGEAANSTGLVTINCSNGPWALSWTDVDFRNCLGYAGDITPHSGATAATVSSGSVWMPDCPYWAPVNPQSDRGFVETDMRQTESPGKYVKTLYSNSKTVLEGLRWDAITSTRSRPQVSPVFTDFQTFWQNTQLGALSYHSVGCKIAFYPSADSATSYEYKVVGLHDSKYQQSVSGWSGCYRITIPRMVFQP